MDIGGWLGSVRLEALAATLLQLLLIVAVTVLVLGVVQRFVDGVVGRLLDREASEGTAQELSAIEIQKRKDTLSTLGGRLLRVLIVVIGFLMALRALDLDIGPAIAGLGVVGLAISLGSQNLVRDYLAGTFILIENQYARGDVVKVADVTGTVEDFNLRRTTLRDIDGTLYTIPNGMITVSGNLTRVWARINVDLVLPATVDLVRVTEVLDGVGQEMKADQEWVRRVLEAPRVDRVEALTASDVTLKVLGSVRASDRWQAAGEFRRRALVRLREAGIAYALVVPTPATAAAVAAPPPDAGAGVTRTDA